MDNTTNTAPASLRDLAVLITLSMTSYSPRILDRAESKKLTDHKGAQAGSAKVIRDRLAGTNAAEVLADITKAQGEARRAFYERTLPWDDGGRRMASNDVAHELFIALKQHEQNIDKLAAKFAAVWPDAAEEARKALNGLWNADDYKATADDMRAKFTVRIDMESMPKVADLRIDAPDAVLNEIREQTERNITARFQAGCREAHSRLYDAIEAMHTKLADPKAVFRDSLVGNLRELLDILPSLNIARDPELTRIGKEARRRLLSFELPAQLAELQPEGPSVKKLAEALRDQPQRRAEAATAAAAILADMRNYLGGAPK